MNRLETKQVFGDRPDQKLAARASQTTNIHKLSRGRSFTNTFYPPSLAFRAPIARFDQLILLDVPFHGRTAENRYRVRMSCNKLTRYTPY